MRLLEKKKAAKEWLREAPQRYNLLKAEVAELSQQLEVRWFVSLNNNLGTSINLTDLTCLYLPD